VVTFCGYDEPDSEGNLRFVFVMWYLMVVFKE
jgi:hypothetical protein